MSSVWLIGTPRLRGELVMELNQLWAGGEEAAGPQRGGVAVVEACSLSRAEALKLYIST